MTKSFSDKCKDNVEFDNRARDYFAKGKFHLEHWRDGKLLGKEEVPNGIATVGLHLVLDQAFRNQSGVATWYLGLVDNASFSAFANADTMSSHAGWIENQDYDEAVRQTWTTVAASARAITNTSVATFTMNASKTIHGFFVTSVSTKGGTTGTLWATGALSTNRVVVAADLIKLTYTVTGPA